MTMLVLTCREVLLLVDIMLITIILVDNACKDEMLVDGIMLVHYTNVCWSDSRFQCLYLWVRNCSWLQQFRYNIGSW